MIIPTAVQRPLQHASAVTLASLAVASPYYVNPNPASPLPTRPRFAFLDRPSDEGDQNGDWASLIGIVTAIVGNILISFALNTQKYAHLRLGREANQHRRVSQKGTPQGAGQKYAKAKRKLRGSTGSIRRPDWKVGDEAQESDPLLSDNHGYDRRSIDSDYTPGEGEDSDSSLEDQAEALRRPKKKASYLSSPYWWLGIVLMTVGEAGNFLAYGFAPASIVSPLGVVALISNCIIAPFMLKEPFRMRDLAGVLIAIGGVVTVVLSANDNNPKLGPDEIWQLIKTWEFETYLGITIFLIISLMFASKKYGRKSIFIDLGLVGLFGAYTALSTKGVASMLSYTLFRALTFPMTYVMVIILATTAIMQIKYLNQALQRFDATQVIPTQFVLFTLSVILGSAVLYRDFERTTGSDAGKFIGGCALTFLGVWIITTGRPHGDEEDLEQDHDLEREHAIHLAEGEEYDDDVVAFDASFANRPSRRQSPADQEHPSSMSATHHRRPSMHRLTTPAIMLSAEVPSQAVTASNTPAFNTPAAIEYDEEDETLTRNPWASESLVSSISTAQNEPPLLHATASAPILPSEAQTLGPKDTRKPDVNNGELAVSAESARPQTPRHHSVLTAPTPSKNQQRTPSPSPVKQTPATQNEPATPATPSTGRPFKRGSIGSLLPGPLTSPLSGGLSAIVADSLRKGVEMRSLPIGSMERPRRNTRERGELLGSFGGWLGGSGVGAVAGPRGDPADNNTFARRSTSRPGRRRSLAVFDSLAMTAEENGSSVGGRHGSASLEASVVSGGGSVSAGASGTVTPNASPAAAKRGRARSASNPLGALLQRVRSREPKPSSSSGGAATAPRRNAEAVKGEVVVEEEEDARRPKPQATRAQTEP
ncbi:magnesium transporter NIPA-domain-containing protein [Phyllosticta citriasiana]|uniref:Magnesium transporter NIPA-domain-containing protein n=1 Tax=Phyllosticta citriasiana TaxID=595635 RepID=A0ABR1L1A2_9PEZI